MHGTSKRADRDRQSLTTASHAPVVVSRLHDTDTKPSESTNEPGSRRESGSDRWQPPAPAPLDPHRSAATTHISSLLAGSGSTSTASIARAPGTIMPRRLPGTGRPT